MDTLEHRETGAFFVLNLKEGGIFRWQEESQSPQQLRNWKARQMVEMSPVLMKRSELMSATKRIVNYGNAGFCQVLSAEVGSKHGFSISGLVFDEIHTQPNRQLGYCLKLWLVLHRKVERRGLR